MSKLVMTLVIPGVKSLLDQVLHGLYEILKEIALVLPEDGEARLEKRHRRVIVIIRYLFCREERVDLFGPLAQLHR